MISGNLCFSSFSWLLVSLAGAGIVAAAHTVVVSAAVDMDAGVADTDIDMLVVVVVEAVEVGNRSMVVDNSMVLGSTDMVEGT
jgi:hypothetical protein